MSTSELPRWLDGDETAAWKAAVALMIKLSSALDGQLQTDSDLSFFGYMVMAALSDRADHSR